MMGRKAARNMKSSITNKIEIQCISWFYSQGVCYDARSYDRKILEKYITRTRSLIFFLWSHNTMSVLVSESQKQSCL